MIHTVYSLQLFICVYSFLVSIGIIFIVRDIIFNSRNFGRIREQETKNKKKIKQENENDN